MQKNNIRDKIISKLKEAQNVLITVSDNPSVDELAAALALTLSLNKAEKHATAVASGQMPDALEFLNPSKTFENSVDSLRDFIIALNKDKADHLRYKLVGDHVKIFITPFRSIITENDLEFEQGDFNVDFVLALGVSNKEHLDKALAAHGRIFHDASVGVLTVGENASELSDLNWHSPNASSISELALELIESDSIGKKSLTKSVATAILTGIIAETDRFSNEKASAKVMNLASKLIMAGADQQLVVSKLKEAEELTLRKEIEAQAKVFETPKSEESTINEEVQESPKATKKKKDTSVLTIERDQNHEDDLEKSLNQLSADLSDESSQNAELTKDGENAKKLAVDFPAVDSPKLSPEISSQSESEEEIQTTDSQIQFEELPIKNTEEPTQLAPADLAQNEVAPTNLTPVENYAPEIPAPSAEFEQDLAFVSEAPVETTTFESAQQADIASEESTQPETTSVEQTPKFGAREYVGDDYYHPEAAQNLAQEIAQNPTILSHDQNANEFTPKDSGVSAHGADLTPPTLGMMADTVQPSVQPVDEQIFAPLPPQVPDFNAMPLPPELPPIPNFDEMNFGEIPAPVNELTQAQAEFEAQKPDVALGSNASNQVMTDQVYQDPAQFRIPGMN